MNTTDKKARDLWKEKELQVHNNVLIKGIQSAFIWGSGGVLGHLLLTRYVPRYAKHTLPYKVFVLLMIPTAAFFTRTDIAAMEADREFAKQFSITKEPIIQPEFNQKVSINKFESFRNFVYENQYKILGYGYFTLVGLSMIYNFANKNIVMQQKFINVRMFAQTGAFMGIAGVAALNVKRPKEREPVKDPYFEQALRNAK